MSIDMSKTKSLGSINFTDAERRTIAGLAMRIGRGDENGNIGTGHLTTTAAKAISERDLLACTAATHVIRGLLDIEKEHGNPMSVDYLRGIHDTLGLAMEHLAQNRMTGGDAA